MNRKVLVSVTLPVVVGILFVLWRSPLAQSIFGYADAPANPSVDLGDKVNEAEKKKGAPLTLDEKKALLPAPVSQIVKTASEMDAGPVNFYARAIDQYGEPVQSALLRASVAGSMLGGYTPLTVQSDSRGALQVSASGSGITVMALLKPGYIFSSATCYYENEPWCEFSETDYFAAASRQPGEKTWFDHQTPETAYTFKMHRLGYIDGVIAGSVFTLAPRNGSEWQTYMFTTERKRSDEPDAPGQLRARLLDRSDDSWKIEIQAVNGGIQLAKKDDAYMSIAPESGYQQTFVFDCKQDGMCNAGNPRRFYFYSNGGKEYGAMVVRIGRRVTGLYRINTKGGRDLNMSDVKQFDLNGNYR